jgi:hypothetical protein
MAETTQDALEAEMMEVFVPFRGFCSRNGVCILRNSFRSIKRGGRDTNSG